MDKKISDNENRRQQHEHLQDRGTVGTPDARPVPPEHVGEEHQQPSRSTDDDQQ
jgi:hypothetical protein